MNTSITSFTKTLAANERWNINQTGSIVRCMTGTASFTVRPDSQNPLRDFSQGLSVSYLDQFQSVEIINDSTPQTLVLYIGDGTIDDARLSLGSGLTVSQSLSANSASDSEDVLVTSTQIITGSALNVGTISIQPQGGDIRIKKGAAAVNDSTSLLITDGQLYECRTAEDIYAISASGVTVTTFVESQQA